MYKSKKNLLKTLLSAGIIVSLMSGIQIKTHAATADQLYSNAYSATSTAVSSHTQKSINDARASIELLKNTSASWAIGEFSKQVDQIQHPFLVKIVDSITKAQQSKKQIDINAAKVAIDPDLPAVWKNSYSSAVDAIQQGLMKDLVDAYDAAAISDEKSDRDDVYTILQEVKLSTDPSIVAWADEFTKPLVTLWSNNDVINIEDSMAGVDANIDSYTNYELNYPNTIAKVYEDNNKNIKAIVNGNDSIAQEFYYTNNQYASAIGEISGDLNTQYINYLYLKDNNLVAWISVELSNNEVKSINIYDNNNLPADLKSKLAVYMQDGNKYLADAKASGK